MSVFRSIRKFLAREAMNAIDISKPIPVAKTKNVRKMVQSPKMKKTVISDVLENPEAFKLEAWIDKNEINVCIKRRLIVDAEFEDDLVNVGQNSEE